MSGALRVGGHVLGILALLALAAFTFPSLIMVACLAAAAYVAYRLVRGDDE